MVPDHFHKLNIQERFLMMLAVDQRSTPEQRALARRRIKTMPYKEFLATEYWLTVRNYVVSTHKGDCVSCHASAATEVHHRSYEHHGEEHLHLADLMPVCRLCHEILQEKFDNRPAAPEANSIERINSLSSLATEWDKIARKIGREQARDELGRRQLQAARRQGGAR